MNAAVSSERNDARSSGERPRASLPPNETQIAAELARPEIAARIVASQGRRRMGRGLRWALAVLNLVLGLAGLLLPGLQGILHLIIGAALLAPDVPAARRLTVRLFRKLPWVRRRLPRAIRELTRKERGTTPGDPPACD